MLWCEKACLAYTTSTEVFCSDKAKFTLGDELVELLAVALLVAGLVVALAHGSHKVSFRLQCCVAVLHGPRRNVSLEKDARGRHDVKSASQILREVVRASAHPNTASLFVGVRVVENVHELLTGVNSNDFHFPSLWLLMQLESNQSRARSDIEHLRLGVAGLAHEASDFINDVVRLVEVDAAGPLIVPLRCQSIVKLANVVTLRIILRELLDGVVSNTGPLPCTPVLISNRSLCLPLLSHHKQHDSQGQSTRSDHEWHTASRSSLSIFSICFALILLGHFVLIASGKRGCLAFEATCRHAWCWCTEGQSFAGPIQLESELSGEHQRIEKLKKYY